MWRLPSLLCLIISIFTDTKNVIINNNNIYYIYQPFIIRYRTSYYLHIIIIIISTYYYIMSHITASTIAISLSLSLSPRVAATACCQTQKSGIYYTPRMIETVKLLHIIFIILWLRITRRYTIYSALFIIIIFIIYYVYTGSTYRAWLFVNTHPSNTKPPWPTDLV